MPRPSVGAAAVPALAWTTGSGPPGSGAGGPFFGSLFFLSVCGTVIGAMSRSGGEMSWCTAGFSVFLRTAFAIVAPLLFASTAAAPTGRRIARAPIVPTATDGRSGRFGPGPPPCLMCPPSYGLKASREYGSAVKNSSPDSELIVRDVRAWRAWLRKHHGEPEGVWLVLAKKGTREPTSLTYDDALEEALCQGWIDGQVLRRDDTTYKQRFTQRRKRSPWSKRNVGIAEGLAAEGRMRPAGFAEIERAKSDGRWEAAYAGPATIEVPDDLAAALAAQPRAQAMFELLTKQNRYAVLYRVTTAKRADTRARRIEEYVAMLARGETPYPQKRRADA